MRKSLLLSILFMFLSFNVWAATNHNVDEIKKNLDQFVTSWNQGNIDSAMEIYKNSSKSLLISDGMIEGYQNIVDFWKKSYPVKDKMGQMNFSNIEVKMLSERYAMAIGKWTLTGDEKPTGGIFTVLFEKTPQGWKSVIDHTTGL